MKKTLLTIASVVFAGTASAANPFLEGPNDRYSGTGDSLSVATAVQPGVGDSYGGNVFSHNDLLGLKRQSHDIPKGTGDSYGSAIPNVEEGTLRW